MNPDIQKLNDLLQAMQVMRDQASNAVVMAQAEIAGLRREVTAKDARIAELEKLNADLQTPTTPIADAA